MSGFLVVLHRPTNTGYAIAPLERAFLRVARNLVAGDSDIHFAYKDLSRGHPETLPDDFGNVLALDLRDRSGAAGARAREYVREHSIDTVLAFDAGVNLPSYRPLREGGVRLLVSYYGAPMGSLNRGLRLLAKRLQVWLNRHGPDHYILESEAMRETAVRGRGIPAGDTTVIPLGVDPERFRPRPGSDHAHAELGIPKDRSIVVYSGHMEPRKGVHIIVRAARELVVERGRRDVHFLFLGNRSGEADRFASLYAGTEAERFITFGGYRDDVPAIFASCDIGCIASTGWDSYTMSSVEMAASGLPLVVSALQGLRETVVPGVTGLEFPPGEPSSLADRLEILLDDVELRREMSAAARDRVLDSLTVDRQVDAMTATLRRLRQ